MCNLGFAMMDFGIWILSESEQICLRSTHGSSEGVGGVKTNEAYHPKADALVITEMQNFWKLTGALFQKL